MKLLKSIQKIPGGLMLVPMLAGALIHTFCPKLLELGKPASAIFSSSGTMCVVGIMLVFAGIQIRPGELLLSLQRSGILIIVKLVLNILTGLFAMKYIGPDGIGGISLVAFIAALTSCNPGVYMALMDQLGDEIDVAGYALLNLAGLPFVPVCILGYAGGNGIDYLAILSTCLPFALGMVLGCTDSSIREFTKSGTAVMLPFMGFCLGSSIDLRMAFLASGPGFLLYLVIMAWNLIPLFLIDRLILRQKGYCAAAICCVAGLAITVPGLMAETDGTFVPYEAQAAPQVAFAVILSTIVTPILVKKLADR